MTLPSSFCFGYVIENTRVQSEAQAVRDTGVTLLVRRLLALPLICFGFLSKSPATEQLYLPGNNFIKILQLYA